jgi:hypothetical protein
VPAANPSPATHTPGAYFLSQRDYLSATSLSFSNAGSNFSQTFETERIAQRSGMSRRDKLHLAGLGLGMTLSVAWTVFLGFALSKAIEWLL